MLNLSVSFNCVWQTSYHQELSAAKPWLAVLYSHPLCFAAVVVAEIIKLSETCQFTALAYQLKRSAKRRSVALQIRSGALTVLAPIGVAKQNIDRFIAQKQQWIQQHIQAQQQHAVTPDYLLAGLIPLLDEQLQLKVVTDSHSAISRDGQTLWLQLSRRVSAERKQQKQLELLKQWYIVQAEQWFAARLLYWQQQMQVQASALQIKNWQRKWGSCTSTGVVSFNWRLMLAPAWVADYVVVHELTHLTHMDHSPAFWQRLAQFYPQYKDVKSWFRAHQHLLDLG